jgi:hypothetical protein
MQIIATKEAYDDPEPVRQFVRMRRRLREEKAPGYPFGFRDVVGVTTSDINLDARTFADAQGVTVIYHNWSNRAIVGPIDIDGKRLGLEPLGRQTKSVTVPPGGLGYLVFR